MQTVTDYTILEARSTATLAEKVRVLIDFGWQPLGGVSSDSNDTCYYQQAMVKYAEDGS